MAGEVFDTGLKRFTTFDDAGGTYSNLGALVGNGFGEATGGIPNTTFTLSGINFDLPNSDSVEIVGIVLHYVAKSNVSNVDTAQSFIRLAGDTSPAQTRLLTDSYRTYRHGGEENLLGLPLNTEDPNNIQVLLGIKQNFGVTGQVSFEGKEGPENIPGVRLYYRYKAEKFIPGPNFMSAQSDLTKINSGLRSTTSNLSGPDNPVDIFGFTSTIILQEDENAKQATNSIYGDNANFGKLATNRGGSTGIDSTTGLVDTSKAPLSVRRGFAGI